MATNFVQAGSQITIPAPDLVSSGAVVIAGSIAVSYYQKRKAASIVQTVTEAVQDGDRFRSAN